MAEQKNLMKFLSTKRVAKRPEQERPPRIESFPQEQAELGEANDTDSQEKSRRWHSAAEQEVPSRASAQLPKVQPILKKEEHVGKDKAN